MIWHDPRVSTALYETHVTVRCSASGEYERLRRWTAVAGRRVPPVREDGDGFGRRPVRAVSGAFPEG